VIWLLVVLERVRGTQTLQVAQSGVFDALTVLHIVMFAFSSLLLVMLALLVAHISHALACAVDSFCIVLISSGDLTQAVPRWNMVHALLRKAAKSIQSCLFVLQATMLFTVLLGAVDFYFSSQQEIGYVDLLGPHAFLTFGIARVFHRAASVTEKCVRVPALINSCNFGNAIDETRQYIVQYVEQSAAGFYVCDIRLTSHITMKFAHVLLVLLVTLGTKMLSDQ